MKPVLLYIDDDADDRSLVCDIIGQLNADVCYVEAEDGEQGLQYIRTSQTLNLVPHTILIDLHLPKLQGKEIYMRLKKYLEGTNYRVIVLSTNVTVPDQEFFRQYDVDLMEKPAIFHEMKKFIHRVVSPVSV